MVWYNSYSTQCVTKRKWSVLEARLAHFGNYRITKQESDRRFLGSIRMIFQFEVWNSSNFVIILKFEIYTNGCYTERHLEFFLEFSVHTQLQQWDLKWKKHDSNYQKSSLNSVFYFWEFESCSFQAHGRKILKRIPDILLSSAQLSSYFLSNFVEYLHLFGLRTLWLFEV